MEKTADFQICRKKYTDHDSSTEDNAAESYPDKSDGYLILISPFRKNLFRQNHDAEYRMR